MISEHLKGLNIKMNSSKNSPNCNSSNQTPHIPNIVFENKFIRINDNRISRIARGEKTLSLPSPDPVSSTGSSTANNFTESLSNFLDNSFSGIGESCGAVDSTLIEPCPFDKSSVVSDPSLFRHANNIRYDALGLTIPDDTRAARLIESNKRTNLYRKASLQSSLDNNDNKGRNETQSLSSFTRREGKFSHIFHSMRFKQKSLSQKTYDTSQLEQNNKLLSPGKNDAADRPRSFDGYSMHGEALGRRRFSVFRRKKRSLDHQSGLNVRQYMANDDTRLSNEQRPQLACPYLAAMQRERSFVHREKS
jgi:hypothetical protein